MAGASVRPGDVSDSDDSSEYERGEVRRCCGCSCCGRIYRHIAEQRVHGYLVSVDLRFSTAILLTVGLGLLVGGAVMLWEALSQHEVVATYSADGPLSGLGNPQRAAVMRGEDVEGIRLPLTSTLEVAVDTDLSAPIYVYYILESFYQNHKRYVDSVSFPQLHGNTDSPDAACDPESQIGGGVARNLPNDGRINPCGLQAWSTFNDSFTSFSVLRGGLGGTPEPIELDASDLVWATDRDFFYAPVEPTNLNTIPRLRGGREVPGPLDKDEDFMAWMRPYSGPNVKKFKGVIREDIAAGDVLLVQINHRYNTYDFGGAKKLLFTTQGSLGGRNPAFGIIWLVFGALFTAAALFFAARGGKQLKSWHERRLWLEHKWAHETSKPAGVMSMASSHTTHTY